MIKFFLGIYDCLVSRRKVVLPLFFLLCALLVWRLLSIEYKEDIADFLPSNEQTERYTEVYRHLGGQDRIVVIFSVKDSTRYSEDERAAMLSAAIESFAAEVAKCDTTGMIANLQLGVDESVMFELADFIRRNYKLFLTDEDYTRIDSLLSVPGFAMKQLENDKMMLMLPAGGVLAENMQYDPLNLFYPVLQRLNSFNLAGENFKIADGMILSGDGNRAFAFFTSPFGMSETHNNEQLARLLDDMVRSVEESVPEVSVSAVGGPLIAVTNSMQIKRDSIWAVSLSLVLIFALLIFSFRRLSYLFWIFAALLFGGVFALGVMACFKSGISVIVLGIGSVIIGIAANYPLHFLDHLKHEPCRRTALKEMVTPLLIGNITTVGAFLCLVFLKAEAMRDLGFFGSFTLVGTILFVLLFMPLFAKGGRVRGEKEDWGSVDVQEKNNVAADGEASGGVTVEVEKEEKLGSSIIDEEEEKQGNRREVYMGKRGNSRVAVMLAVPVLLLTLLFGYFSLDTSFDSNIQHINYMTEQQRADMAFLQKNISDDSTEYIYAVSQGSTMQEALENNEKLTGRLNGFVGKGRIMEIKGIGNFMPSVAAQMADHDKWTELWSRHADIVDSLQLYKVRAGFSSTAFAPFFEGVANTGISGDSGYIKETGYFAPIMDIMGKNYLIEEDSLVRVVNYLKVRKDDSQEVRSEIERAGIMVDGSFVFDSGDVGNQLVSILSDEFNYIGFICGFVVFFFLWLSFASVELSLLSFLPLAVSWLWILGIMQILGIQFNIVSVILAAFIFGQGDDYTIFITEGLVYEYAYGKRLLASYKRSVALSAAIMFAGMGMLLFAKHPALNSLAVVAIIGMITVVVMAYYLPPLVFRWITTKGGEYREVPLTLGRIFRSVKAFAFFLFAAYFYVLPYGFITLKLLKPTEKRKLRFHKLLQRLAKFAIYRIPGAPFILDNPFGESFEKPAVIICNHQSHIDLMCTLMLSPKIVVLTNDWVWNNPFYGRIIKFAEFYPVSNGAEAGLGKMKELMDRGYSILVFPEGTRSEDCSVQRFHKGAFYLARQLKSDIVPLFIHGFGHVLPKKDFMLRPGNLFMQVGKRVSSGEIERICNGVEGERQDRVLTSCFSKIYKNRLEELRCHLEDMYYFMGYAKLKYYYKGAAVEAGARRMFKKMAEKDLYHLLPDKESANMLETDAKRGVVWIRNSGQGEFALLFALAHKNMVVYAFERDEDSAAVAANISYPPKNLNFVHLSNDDMLREYPAADYVFDVTRLFGER